MLEKRGFILYKHRKWPNRIDLGIFVDERRWVTVRDFHKTITGSPSAHICLQSVRETLLKSTRGTLLKPTNLLLCPIGQLSMRLGMDYFVLNGNTLYL